MGYETKKDANLVTVKVEGRLTAALAPDFREDVLALVQPGTNVLFDLEKMVHIDSSGLGALVQVLQRVRDGGGRVVLAALQPAPKVVFDVTRVSRIFEIVPTAADAKF